MLTNRVLLETGDERLPARGRRQERIGEWDRMTSGGTLPAVLRVMAREVVCKAYLLDAKTQIVDTVRFISFTIRSSDLSHKLGQAVVEFGS